MFRSTARHGGGVSGAFLAKNPDAVQKTRVALVRATDLLKT
jgi:hypothetical protein